MPAQDRVRPTSSRRRRSTVRGSGRSRAASSARSAGWNWTRWSPSWRCSTPSWLQSYLDFESAAALIRSFEVQFVPGLLQTEEYARAVIQLGYRHASPTEIDRRVALRMTRQHLLTQPNPPRLWAVMDEAVLRRPIGGSRVMHDQLHALAHAATRPNVHLQIMPFGAGGHAAAGGAFTILRFPDEDLPDVVYLEHLTDARFLTKRDEVERYSSTAARLIVEAETPGRTADILCDALNNLDKVWTAPFDRPHAGLIHVTTMVTRSRRTNPARAPADNGSRREVSK